MSDHGIEFDPRKYMQTIERKNKDGRIIATYQHLPVRARIKWIRQTYPDAKIITDPISFDGESVLFRCRIEIPETGAEGSGHAYKRRVAYPDGGDKDAEWISKCETKAMGRALVSLGFDADSDDFDDEQSAAAAPRRIQRPQAERIAALKEALGGDIIDNALKAIGTDRETITEEQAARLITFLDFLFKLAQSKE